ncbi:MAG TPA: glycosyltransferase family 39 protein [Verrucomicrobiae bacterium]|nr:glycosyltransferase family 39 protein [Verrucomicrobiae bacterium]
MNRRFAALVACVVILAAAARLLRCGEGLPYLHTWDEPYVAGQALHMMQTGTLDPGFFNYGSVAIYLCLGVDVLHFFHLMGRPETAPGGLARLDDIRTRFQTDWFWTISHPGFYLWDRRLVALLGTATVFLTYLIGRRVAGRFGGVAAAACLAGMELHVAQSALITVDVPTTFFVTLAAWLVVLFAERERPALLVGAMAVCGLAISTKYNAAVSLSIPLLALAEAAWRSSAGYRRWLWVALLVIPAIAFLAGTPYALLDLPRFLDGAGGELRHYKVLGHGNETIAPGWPHLMVESTALQGHLGLAGSALALGGLAAMGFRKVSRGLVAYPILHVLLMAQTRVFFPRNLVVVLPFLAVAFGAGVVFLWRRLRRLGERRTDLRLAAPAFVLFTAVLLTDGMGVALAKSWEAGAAVETRTMAMDRVASIAGAPGAPAGRIGIAEELRVHESDVRKVAGGADVRPFLDLICRPDPYRLVVVPDSFAGLLARFTPAAEVMSAVTSSRLKVRERIGTGNVTYLDRYSVDPAVRILEAAPSARGQGACVDYFEPKEFVMPRPYDVGESGALELVRKGSVSTPWVYDGAGTLAGVFRATGRWGAGEYPKLKITALRFVEKGDPIALARRTFELTWTPDPYALIFVLPEGALISLKVEYLNGSDSDAPPGRRKVTLEPIALLRLP